MAWIEDYQKRISYQDSINFLAALSEKEYFIITDNNLEKLYQKRLFPTNNYFSIKAGEASKTMVTINEILEILLENNYSRNVIIIGFGGGVVCDIAGFVSAIYKRGCALALLPSSLIAMVDASIGGKNGVNSLNFKNQFGTIKQADYINIDLNLLKTLPLSEIANGMAEIIKHGLINSLSYYEKVRSYDISRDDKSMTQLSEIIKESIAIKLTFVSGDENDREQRRFLNFGHTLGHAIEKNHNIGHGKAVLWGMIQAIKLSFKLRMISEELFRELKADLDRLNIVSNNLINWDEISRALLSDKKRESEKVTFILLKGVGNPLVKEIELDVIKQVVMTDDENLLRNN